MTDWLTKLKEIGEKAAKGPWGVTYDGSSTWSVGEAEDPQDRQVCSIYDRGTDCFDGKFICLSRNLWPEIVAVIEAAENFTDMMGDRQQQEEVLISTLAALRSKVEGAEAPTTAQ